MTVSVARLLTSLLLELITIVKGNSLSESRNAWSCASEDKARKAPNHTWLMAPTAEPSLKVSNDFCPSLQAEKEICLSINIESVLSYKKHRPHRRGYVFPVLFQQQLGIVSASSVENTKRVRQ
jgi:hypothetical protein